MEFPGIATLSGFEQVQSTLMALVKPAPSAAPRQMRLDIANLSAKRCATLIASRELGNSTAQSGRVLFLGVANFRAKSLLAR